MKVILNIILLLLIINIRSYAQTKIIDHLCNDIHSIPLNWIDSAKSNLNIFYARASHGSQLTSGGMTALMKYSQEYAVQYNFNATGGNDALPLYEITEDLQHQNSTWVSTTENYLASHPECNVVMWAWCGIYEMDIDKYLADMEALISKYGSGGTVSRENPVNFVFMNAHTWPYPGEGIGEWVYNANQKIRKYCEENNRWFYDFYDLECWDPDSNYFGDGTPERVYNGEKRLRWDCSYDLVGEGRGNWGIEWMLANPDAELTELAADDICVSCQHSDGGKDDNSRLHCVLKGNAAWWLWASLAGWGETDPVKLPVSTITVSGANGSSTIDTYAGTLQLTASILPVNADVKTVIWSIQNGTGQASINSTGLVTAIANGTVTATATATDGSGVKGNLTLTISGQTVSVTGITVTGAGGATTITSAGGTLQLTATVTPANASNKNVTWSITNGSDYAGISSSGLVTALANGTVTATATAVDGSGEFDTLSISIYGQIVMVESITVAPINNALSVINEKNGTLQMTAEINPSNVTNDSIIWSVENQTGSAAIDNHGLLTGISDGSVLVVVAAQDGSNVSGSCTVTIINQSVSALENSSDIDICAFQDQHKLLIKNTDKIVSFSGYSVFNALGMLIKRDEINTDTIEIDVSSYHSGIYIIYLYNNQEVFPIKILIH